jgi:peptidyl-prolyl cis-trans isomerase A (cyclophilin A)
MYAPLLALVLLAGASDDDDCKCGASPLCFPMGAEMRAKAPEVFRIVFDTTRGEFEVESRRAWAPHGADRLYNLARLGFLDDTAFYRTIHTPACSADWVVQFGVSGDPAVSCVYNSNPPAVPQPGAILADDAVSPLLSNTQGVLAYSAVLDAARGGAATNRTTELFISYGNHSQLDALGFAPVAVVTRGYEEVVRALYAGYGEMADMCDLHGYQPCAAPTTEQVYGGGNAFLRSRFPRLDFIRQATVLAGGGGDDDGVGGGGGGGGTTGADVMTGLAVTGLVGLAALGLRRARERRALLGAQGGRASGGGEGGLLGCWRSAVGQQQQDASSNLMLADFGDASVRHEQFTDEL